MPQEPPNSGGGEGANTIPSLDPAHAGESQDERLSFAWFSRRVLRGEDIMERPRVYMRGIFSI
jgi:hypothetical protein